MARREDVGELRLTRLDLAGEPPITHFRTQKTASLLGYLAYHPHQDHPREELTEILWPEDDRDSGRHKLNVALSALRAHKAVRYLALAGTIAVVLLSAAIVTTLLVVTQSFLSAHPDIVADLVKAQVQANDFIKSNPTQAQADANAELGAYTGKPLKADLVAASFKEITFTNDPDAASLKTDADQAVSLGLLKPVNLTEIYDLGPLNKALTAAGASPIGS